MEAHGTELEPSLEEAVLEAETPASTTLFRTDNPTEVLEQATTVATALKDVLVKQHLTTPIQGKEHVNYEGWLTLGAMLGVTPVLDWTRKLEGKDGYEARVYAKTLDGRIIGAAESMCTREETRWSKADDHAIRSMAQTRAGSKALASVLRFVVTLAGYSGTPAEEMDFKVAQETTAQVDEVDDITHVPPQETVRLATPKQQRLIWAKAAAAGLKENEAEMRRIFREVAGTEHTERIPMDKVDDVLEAIAQAASTA